MKVEELVNVKQLETVAAGAARFERNEFMERLIEMRRTRPQSFAGMSPAAKLALGHYEAGKRRAEMLAADNA